MSVVLTAPGAISSNSMALPENSGSSSTRRSSTTWPSEASAVAEQRRGAGDFHLLRDVADHHLHVDFDVVVDAHLHVFADELLEAGAFGADVVEPVDQEGQGIVAAISLVLADTATPVATLTALTSAVGTTAPLESVTRPRMVPRDSWAFTVMANNSGNKARAKE